MFDINFKNLLVLLAVVVLLVITVKLFSQYDDIGYGTVSGDVNADGQICMDDSIETIHYLWGSRDLTCPDAADVDRNGAINITDVVMGLRHVFFGESIPDCPVTCYPGS